MSLSERIKKIKNLPKQVLARAKYDDLLYTFLQIGAASLAVSAPAVAAVAIYITVMQDKEKKYNSALPAKANLEKKPVISKH